MWSAFGWGLVAGSSLVIGALIALRFQLRMRTIGLVMGFGAGVLISAIAFDLVEEATHSSSGQGALVLGMFAGCLTFSAGDALIDRFGGSGRKDATGEEGGAPLSIVLGTVLDGIPESMVIGVTIYEGGAVGAAYLAAVFVSNLPESISSSTGLTAAGWKPSRIVGMWGAIALVSAVSSMVGYVLFQGRSPDTVAFILTFAAGAILTMLADTMMPEAYEHGGKLAGIVTTLGFVIAFGIHSYA